jgi:dCTP deaminase
MFLSDTQILDLCENKGLLTPFVKESIKKTEDGESHVSHGPSSYGYDITLDRNFKILKPSKNFLLNYAVQFDEFNKLTKNKFLKILDPTNIDQSLFKEVEADYILLPPNSFLLGVSKEKFNMPRNLTGIVSNKSTYARIGLDCFTTVIEAGWRGYLVLEFSNNTPFHLKVSANQGIAQILFEESTEDCAKCYDDRGGKYQDQVGVQHAKC